MLVFKISKPKSFLDIYILNAFLFYYTLAIILIIYAVLRFSKQFTVKLKYLELLYNF